MSSETHNSLKELHFDLLRDLLASIPKICKPPKALDVGPAIIYLFFNVTTRMHLS